MFTLNTASSSVNQKGRVKDQEGNNRDSQSNRNPLVETFICPTVGFLLQAILDFCCCFHFQNVNKVSLMDSILEIFSVSKRKHKSVCGQKSIPRTLTESRSRQRSWLSMLNSPGVIGGSGDRQLGGEMLPLDLQHKRKGRHERRDHIMNY